MLIFNYLLFLAYAMSGCLTKACHCSKPVKLTLQQETRTDKSELVPHCSGHDLIGSGWTSFSLLTPLLHFFF